MVLAFVAVGQSIGENPDDEFFELQASLGVVSKVFDLLLNVLENATQYIEQVVIDEENLLIYRL